jgi:hypothetical protein
LSCPQPASTASKLIPAIRNPNFFTPPFYPEDGRGELQNEKIRDEIAATRHNAEPQ